MNDVVPPHPPPDDDEPEPAPRRRVTVQLVDNPAGVRKTRGLCHMLGEQYRTNPAGLHAIVAAPTKELLQDYVRLLADPDVGNIPDNVVRLITADTGKKTVRVQMRAYLERQPPDAPAILCITHAGAMLERPPEWDDNPGTADNPKNRDPRTGEFVPKRIWNPADWDFTWDEAPDVLTFHHFECPFTHRKVWSRLVKSVPYRNGLLELRPADSLPDRWDADEEAFVSYEGKLTTKDALLNVARQQPPDMGQQYAAKLCGAIANPQKVVAVLSELQTSVLDDPDRLIVDGQWEDLMRSNPKSKGWLRGELDLMEITSPQGYGVYRSMTIMGARLEQTMCLLLWRKLFHIHTVKHPLSDRLPDAHEDGPDRLEALYVWEHRASRTWLKRQGKTGDTLFREAAAAIASIFQREHDKLKKAKKGDLELPMWNAPQPGPDKDHGVANTFFAPMGAAKKQYEVTRNWYDPDMRLPGKSHGLNRPEFLDCRTVVLLSILRYAPNHYEILARLGVTAEEIDCAFQFNANYQDMMRSNIRVAKDSPAFEVKHSKTGTKITVTPTGKVRVYFLDRPSAEDFVSSFAKLNGVVKQIPADLVPEPAREQPSRPNGQVGPMTASERARKWREQQKANRAHAAEQRQRMAERRAEVGDDAARAINGTTKNVKLI